MSSLVALVSMKPRMAPYVNQDPGGLGAFKGGGGHFLILLERQEGLKSFLW